MLIISEILGIEYLIAKDKYNLDNIFNKQFTIADTSLTYRQVNSLSNDSLLPNNREKKEGWRKFRLKELIYISIIYELKCFGLKHTQLKELYDSFFKESEIQDTNIKPKYAKVQINKAVSDTAIGLVLGHVEILLTINSDGNVIYYDSTNYSVIGIDYTPHIVIRLNDIINKILEDIGKDPFPIKMGLKDLVLEGRVTPKEQEVINIIRNKDYITIKIKKDRENFVINAEKKTNNKISPTEEDIIKILQKKDFQDIEIKKRNGKIVSLRVEETRKL